MIWHRQNAVLMHVKNKSSARNANSIPRTHGQKSMTSFNLSSNDIVQSMRWESKHFYPFLALPYRFNFSRLLLFFVNQSDTVFYFRWTAIFNRLQYTKLRCIYNTSNMYLSLEGFLIKKFRHICCRCFISNSISISDWIQLMSSFEKNRKYV